MEWIDEIIGRLSGLGEIAPRPIARRPRHRLRGTIFGIVFEDRLYLKVGDRSKADFVSRGMGPSRPNRRQALKSYYEVPPGVLADPEAPLSWAREAIRAAQSSQSPG